MLSLEIDKVLAEVHSQAQARDDRLHGAEDLLQRYPGPWWNGAPAPTQQFDSENASFEYVSYGMSQLVWANPRWRVSTRRPRAQQMVAEAMGLGLNRWTADDDLKTALEDLAVDYNFAWSVALVSQRPRQEVAEAEDSVIWPQVSRISPWDFGFDHRAKSWRNARMLWHEYRIDKDDAIRRAKFDRKLPKEEREGWLLEALEDLTTTNDPPHRSAERAWIGKQEGPDREQIRVLEVFLPGLRMSGAPGPEEGFNGTTLTIGCNATSSDGVYLKPPRPFFGPRWGPYVVAGTYIVPDCPFPLSLLMAAAGHIAESTRISQAVDNQVKNYKRLMLIAAGSPELAKLIKSGVTDHVYSARQVAELDKFVREYEMGGTTPGNIAAEQRSINRRNRILGMDEVQRGNVTGEGTATEVQLAVEAALGRQGYVKGRFQDGVRRLGKTVAWYLYHTDEVFFPLGADAAEQLGIDPNEGDVFFKGGDFQDGSGATFDDLGLEIEPYSMERPSEALLRQRGELIANSLQLLPAIAQAASIGGDAKGLLDAYGDAYGMPQFSRLFPGIGSADLSGIQPTEAQPRLGRDLGAIGKLRYLGGGQRGGTGGGRQLSPQDFAAFAG